MGRQIIKQPNGKYAIWSTIVDHFIMVNATPELILESDVRDFRERRRGEIERSVEELGINDGVSRGFSKTFDEALDTIRMTYGEQDVETTLALIADDEDDHEK